MQVDFSRLALGVSEVEIGLVIAAYTFPAAILAPIFGGLADRYGRKEILIPNLILFGVAGTLCGTVTTLSAFVFFRVLQGVGVAGMLPICTVLIGDLFEDHRRVEAMGAQFIATNMTVAILAPLVGFAAAFSWQTPLFFYILTVPLAITIFLKLDVPKSKNPPKLSLSYYKTTLGFLRNRGVAAAFIMGITRPILLYGPYVTYMGLWITVRFDTEFQENMLKPTFVIGLLMAFMQLIGAVFASRGKWLHVNVGRHNLPPLGLFLYTIALCILPFSPSLSVVFLGVAIFGAGHGILLPHIYNYLNEVTPIEHRAGLISLFNSFFYGGQTLGPIIFGVVFRSFGEASGQGYTGVFLIGSLMALISAIIGTILFRSVHNSENNKGLT